MSGEELRAALLEAIRIAVFNWYAGLGPTDLMDAIGAALPTDAAVAALAAPSTPEPSGPDTEGTTFCPCGAAWIGTRVHGATEQRSHAEFHASGGPGLGAPHDPGLATFVPDRAAPSTLRPCATCGHAAGGHMPECTNGICKCRRFRAAPSTPEPSGPIDYNPYPNPFDENGDFIEGAPSTPEPSGLREALAEYGIVTADDFRAAVAEGGILNGRLRAAVHPRAAGDER